MKRKIKMEKPLQNLVKKKLKNLADLNENFHSKLDIINKILVSNVVSFRKKGFKYSIGYKMLKNKDFLYISSKNELI